MATKRKVYLPTGNEQWTCSDCREPTAPDAAACGACRAVFKAGAPRAHAAQPPASQPAAARQNLPIPTRAAIHSEPPSWTPVAPSRAEALTVAGPDGRLHFGFHGKGFSLLLIHLGAFLVTAVAVGALFASGFHMALGALFKGGGFPPASIALLVAIGLVPVVAWAWTRARLHRFWAENTSLGDHRFRFDGKWTEILRSVLVAGLFVLGLAGANGFAQVSVKGSGILEAVHGWIWIFLGLTLWQLANFGTWRYRASRFSIGNSRFDMQGDWKTYSNALLPHTLLAALTFVWLPVMFHTRHKLIYNRLSFLGHPFAYHGDPKAWFLLSAKGFLLTVLTFGLYRPWWKAASTRYLQSHLTWGGQPVQGDFQTSDFVKLKLINGLLLAFTFGAAHCWVQVRNARFAANHLSLPNLAPQATATNPRAVPLQGEGLSKVLDVDVGLAA